MTDYSEFILKNLYKLNGYRAFFPRPNITFGNPNFEDAGFRVIIVRLSPLHNVSESVTHNFLFQEVRRALPEAYVDYAFFPDPKNIPLFSDNRIPFFLGLQSLRPVSDFDLVLISNSFSLELFNLPYLFLHSALPALKSERLPLRAPLIIMGGSNSLMAQCAISPEGDSFIDALFFGEGEGAVGRIVSIVKENRERNKAEILRELERNIPGFFDIRIPIPDSIRVSPKAPQASYILTDYPILNTDNENTVKLQITQGCQCFCSFCFEGFTRKPFREYNPEDIIKAALIAKLKHAPSEIDFLSFNFNMHGQVSKIITDLNGIVKFVNFKSQRADIIALCPELLDIEMLSGKRSFTIGVEGISERMRRYLHKSMAEQELMAALEHIYARKPRQLKLFFIITGLEEGSDLREFKEFIMKIKRLKTGLAPRSRTIMSFGLLANMPFTPMQFKSHINPASIKLIKGDLKRDCETNGFEFRMAQDSEEFLISQHIVLAGHECFKPIFDFAKRGGYFDGENIIGDKKELLMSLRSASGHGLYDKKNKDYVFPFEKIKGIPDKTFLYRMYDEATRFIDRGYCLEGKGGCTGCGGCEDRKIPNLPAVSQEDMSRLKKIVERKKRPETTAAVVTIKETARFLRPEAKCAFIGRALLEWIPSLAFSYLSCRQVQNIEAAKGYGSLFGRFLYNFEFLSDSRFFSEFLEKRRIETPLLIISSAPENDAKMNGRHCFRITSCWKDCGTYSFQNRFQDFLLGNGMGFDIRKSCGLIHFEVAAKDKKKKLLYSAVLEQEKNNISLDIETGARFAILPMLEYLFGDEWMNARVESVEL